MSAPELLPSPPDNMRADPVVVVSLEGHADIADCAWLRELPRLHAERGPAHLIVDLSLGSAADVTVMGGVQGLPSRAWVMASRMGEGANQAGRAGRLMEAGEVLTAAGLSGAVLAARSRTAAALSGIALLAGSACTRFGIFEAGRGSARDPRGLRDPGGIVGPETEPWAVLGLNQ